MQKLSRSNDKRPIVDHRFRALTLSALVIGGCASFAPSESMLPVGAVPMIAPPEYRAWFAKTEACSRLNGQFQGVQWFVVPEAETFATPEGPKVGMWEKSGAVARIVIAGRYADHEMVVRHEMLHHLLDREGHPPQFFVDRCHLTWESWVAVADR